MSCPINYRETHSHSSKHGIHLSLKSDSTILRFATISGPIGSRLLLMEFLTPDKQRIVPHTNLFDSKVINTEILYEGEHNRPYSPTNSVIHEYVEGEALLLPDTYSAVKMADGMTGIYKGKTLLISGHLNGYDISSVNFNTKDPQHVCATATSSGFKAESVWRNSGSWWRETVVATVTWVPFKVVYTRKCYRQKDGVWVYDPSSSYNRTNAVLNSALTYFIDTLPYEPKALEKAFIDFMPYHNKLNYELTANDIENLYRGLPILGVNNIQNILDLISLRKLSLQGMKGRLSNLPQSLRGAKLGKLKSLSNLFLFKKYGLDTALSDITEMIGYIKTLQYAKSTDHFKLHSTGPIGGFTSGQYNITIDIGHFEPSWLQKLGLTPNLSNCWDALPFSFVIDWFIDLGEQMSYVDKTNLLQGLIKCKQPIMSMKAEVSPVLTTSPNIVIINARQVVYKRFPLTSLPVPTKDISFFGGVVIHGVEGLALIISQLR